MAWGHMSYLRIDFLFSLEGWVELKMRGVATVNTLSTWPGIILVILLNYVLKMTRVCVKITHPPGQENNNRN